VRENRAGKGEHLTEKGRGKGGQTGGKREKSEVWSRVFSKKTQVGSNKIGGKEAEAKPEGAFRNKFPRQEGVNLMQHRKKKGVSG